LLSSPDAEAGLQQQEAQKQQQHGLASSPDTMTESYRLLASLQLLSEDSRVLRGVEAAAAPWQATEPADAAGSCSTEDAAFIDSIQARQQQQEHASLPQPQQQELAASTDHSYQLLASLKLLSTPTCTAEQVAAVGADLDATAGSQLSEGGQQQQQQQCSDAEEPSALESGMSVQFNELYQLEGDLAAAGTAVATSQLAAGPAVDALQAAQHSLSSTAGGSPGLAQVERALLKLQTLRSTLQSLGSSAASSRQQSLRASRAISATGESALCSPEASSSHLPGGSSSGVFAQRGSAAAASTSPEDAAGLTAPPAEQAEAGTVSAREWIEQLSQRIQQAGTGDTSTAAQLEAAMASLQAQQAGKTAAVADYPGEPAALADAANWSHSSQGSLSVQLIADSDTAAAFAATAAMPLSELPAEPAENNGIGSSSSSSRASPRASTPLLQLLDSHCTSEASEESACSPAVVAAATAAAAAAAAVAAAAACEEAAASAGDSTVAAELDAGRAGTPTGDMLSNPWLARLAFTGPGSPNWSTATANSVSTVEEASQQQDNAYGSSTAAGNNAPPGAVQQPAADLMPSSAMESVQADGTAAHSELLPVTGHLQQQSRDMAAAAAAAAASPGAAGGAAVGGSEAVVPAAPSGRFQQMLDASDDTALLLSLALKLDTLAKKFRGQVCYKLSAS
jgi:hypothetical protein